MCLAIPMKIIDIEGDSALCAAGGVKRRINISFLRDAKKGDYVMVHAGFAIERLNPERAKETLRILEDL